LENPPPSTYENRQKIKNNNSYVKENPKKEKLLSFKNESKTRQRVVCLNMGRGRRLGKIKDCKAIRYLTFMG